MRRPVLRLGVRLHGPKVQAMSCRLRATVRRKPRLNCEGTKSAVNGLQCHWSRGLSSVIAR